MIPDAVRQWCREAGYGALVGEVSVGGGCINNAARLRTAAGQTFFLKTNARLPADMFPREMDGLLALRAAAEIIVPQPLLCGPDYLLMEDLMPAGRSQDFWTTLGRQLANLHGHTAERFGFVQDNYIGATPQRNTWQKDGFDFFAEQRLGYQTDLAVRRGLLGAPDARRVEKLAARLREWIPAAPPALLHGDLWSGNVISDASGRPAIIDPAVYYGWAEADLAMTALFGGFPAEFYRAYEEVRPLTSGWRDRLPLYNLYHLLNHLNLFGEGYLSQVRTVLARFA